ncbi:nitrogen fixation protein FixH [Rhodovulum imhoffii]|uniref:Nitrogen fixation protein FixH n=1 Tax=Rhodovulum imhoffii TaxID=365340 RepID=A0A2T5BPG9_9RHOB|nr:FixH family protein [Rhodovulum imhoffii]MBK5932624.1 nitrogen fixation protein FixH [Rhodovulum imhoffii]PTN00922.1 nitrogen fixation protein FixH [Rhodovulum imhoffii]
MSNELTGRKVLIITVSAFAVVIAVNLTLAFQAVSTFPGLEVKNSYVASQEFDANRAAQQALGWQVEAVYDGGVLALRISEPDGTAAPVTGLEVVIGRATHVKDDQTPSFTYADGLFRTPLDLAAGYWNLRLTAQGEDGALFRQRIELLVRNES